MTKYKTILEKRNKEVGNDVEWLAETVNKCLDELEAPMTNNQSKLETDDEKLQSLKKKHTQLKTELEERIEYKLFNDIKALNDKIKKLNSFYTTRRALEQQNGLLNAYKYFFGTLNYKILEAVKREKNAIIDKSVNELLMGEEAIIKTNYLSKDDLQKIKDQQTKEDKKNHGNVAVVLRYNDKFLKEAKYLSPTKEKRIHSMDAKKA